ncbi:MAG: hypothetical protein KF689_10365 [Gemmatimonadaceae bacterium]|nr:hypothetical protein [Gemmatimonadaceae bacterium]MCW5825999.1 hypothetical protein [Gemmatimonadaceae bacterium]
MTFFYVDLMFALLLLGVALFTGCCLVFNPVLKSVRVMGIGSAYAIALWMAIALPWKIALATWCLFAAFGGAVAMAYELWARWRYRGTGRAPRPLVLLEGFLLWPTMVPEAVEGALIDAGVLEPSWRPSLPAGELHQRR